MNRLDASHQLRRDHGPRVSGDEPLETYLKTGSLSQSEFARRAGIRQGQVWSVLQGGGLSLKNALKVHAASGGAIDLDELIGGHRG